MTALTTPTAAPMSASSPAPAAADPLLAAANMRRLLEVYRTLAPLTIGGPSSTSLEPPQPGPGPGVRPPTDPRLLRKFAPWLLGPVFPPPPPPQVSAPWPGEAAPAPCSTSRKRRYSSEGRGPGRAGGRGSPAPPIFIARDKESSRFRLV